MTWRSVLSMMNYKNYSVLRLFTGLAIAAFINWKLTVTNAINNTSKPAALNMHQERLIR